MEIASVDRISAPAGFQVIFRVTFADGMVSFVPQSLENSDYRRVEAWLAAGNTLDSE